MICKLPWVVLGLALAAVGSAARADSLDINLNSDAARLAYALAFKDETGEVDFSWLHHQDEGDVVAVGLHATGLASRGARIRVGVGGKLFYFDGNVDSAIAAGVGGHVSYLLPALERLVLTGYLYYAPDVLTFSGGEAYREVGAQVGYRVIERVDVYLGLRGIRGNFEDAPSVEFDSGLHGGFRVRF